MFKKSRILLALILGFGVIVWLVYQLRKAEAGYPNHFPRIAREFLARREYQMAKNSPYKDHQLIGYTQAVRLDPDHFPDAWEYLCTFYVNAQEWEPATIACNRAENLAGPTAQNQKAMGKIYEHYKGAGGAP